MSRLIERARALIERPGAWLDQADQHYPLRLGGDRRSRVILTLDETSFRALIERPGLRLRPGGGWVPRAHLRSPSLIAQPPGKPGMIEGERKIMLSDGQLIRLRANLGESPILWLARRKDASGRAWLTPTEVAAGERLRSDAELALRGASVTMAWDGLPRSSRGTARRYGPADRAISASARVEAALQACDPSLRSIVAQICIHGSSLQLAEQSLSLRRRQGKTVLKQGLQALADHYGLGR